MLTPDAEQSDRKKTQSAATGRDDMDKRGEASYSKRPAPSPEQNTDKLVKEYGTKKKKKKRKTALIVLGVIVVLIVAAFAAFRIWSQPPATNQNGPSTPNVDVDTTPAPTPTTDLSASPSPTVEPTDDPNDPRKPGCYTFLIVGLDQVGNNTDTIMVGMMDTKNHTLDVISIPRDTLANVSWGTKRINTIYAAAVNTGKDGVQALKDGVRDMLGFEVDSYAVVDLTAFVELVDAIGGVDYDVPVDMYYDAPDQGLHIAIPAGPTHLNGEEALKVVRFRAGYANADLGRIETQQDFLSTVAKQMLTLGNIPNLPEFIRI